MEATEAVKLLLGLPALGYIAYELIRLRIKVAGLCTDLRETKKSRALHCEGRRQWINKVEATAERADHNATVCAAKAGCQNQMKGKES